MKPPPPMLPAVGCVTASAKAVATAASTAVPPAEITSAPIFDAISFCDATMPFCARIGTELAPVAIVMTHAAIATRNRRALFMRPSGGGLYALHLPASAFEQHGADEGHHRK